MLDELISNSFELDYDIYLNFNYAMKKFSNDINIPKLESEDIYQEFENYFTLTRKIISKLTMY